MIRVGIIGAGFMGKNHYNQYEKLVGRVEFMALCDKEADRRMGDWSAVGGNIGDAQGRKQDLGRIATYEDWHELVADPHVDLVDICAPTFLHREMVTEALRAGKHVLCEKPMGLTVEDCDEMLTVAAEAKGQFMIAQVIRFWPEYVYLKQVFDDQRFGELKALNLRRQVTVLEHALNNWIIAPELSGGSILDLHVHDVDYALRLLGKPRSLFACGYERIPGSVDRVYASWDYGPGLVVQIEAAGDIPTGFGFNMGMTAVFESGAVIWDFNSGKPLTVYRPGREPEAPQVGDKDGYFAEIEYFASCIEGNEPPRASTPQESRDAVAIALAEKESVLTGSRSTPGGDCWRKRS